MTSFHPSDRAEFCPIGGDPNHCDGVCINSRDYSNGLLSLHYANMSVQYTAIFHGCKNDNFQMKIFDIFLIFAQNIDCGYTLEPPQRGGSNEYPQSMF